MVEVKEVSINTLKFMERIMYKDEEVDPITESIKARGFMGTIVISKDNYVIDGGLRITASKKAGMESVPAFVVDINCSEHYVQCMNIRHMLNELKYNKPTPEERRKWVGKLVLELAKANAGYAEELRKGIVSRALLHEINKLTGWPVSTILLDIEALLRVPEFTSSLQSLRAEAEEVVEKAAKAASLVVAPKGRLDEETSRLLMQAPEQVRKSVLDEFAAGKISKKEAIEKLRGSLSPKPGVEEAKAEEAKEEAREEAEAEVKPPVEEAEKALFKLQLELPRAIPPITASAVKVISERLSFVLTERESSMLWRVVMGIPTTSIIKYPETLRTAYFLFMVACTYANELANEDAEAKEKLGNLLSACWEQGLIA